MISLASSLRALVVRQTNAEMCRFLHVGAALEAARKGTREKAKKKKTKKVEKKLAWQPRLKKDQISAVKQDKHLTDEGKPEIPTDTVWLQRYHRSKVWSLAEAIEAHKETHDPTQYNRMSDPLIARIELYMVAEKKTRFVDSFRRTAYVPHKFQLDEERNVIVFTKDEAEQAEARKLGATMVGGTELIKKVTSGDVSLADYPVAIAHPNILAELVALRGIMKRRFPNQRSGTLSSNLIETVHKFCNGINYQVVRDEYQLNFGHLETTVGQLSMPTEHLVENIIHLLTDLNSARPKRDGPFITRSFLVCPPGKEKFLIDTFAHIPKEYSGAGKVKAIEEEPSNAEDDDEQEEPKASAAENAN